MDEKEVFRATLITLTVSTWVTNLAAWRNSSLWVRKLCFYRANGMTLCSSETENMSFYWFLILI